MHELLTRSGLYLPELTSKWCTKQMLLDIRKKLVHTLKQSDIVFRICLKPPSSRALATKLQEYANMHNMTTGIDMETENFPDKAWMVLAIATLSGGKDEIFDKNYLPKPEDMRRIVPDALMIDNSDGLFDNIDPRLFKNKKGRRMNLSGLDTSEKINTKMQKKQLMINKYQ